LPRLLLALFSKDGKNNGNDKNYPTDSQELTGSLHISSHAQWSRSDVVRLVDPTDIAIRRYVKVKSDANPFDPLWRGYFESRKRFRGANPRR
jgi:hypothetical protein